MNKLTKILLMIFFIILLSTTVFGVQTTTIERLKARRLSLDHPPITIVSPSGTVTRLPFIPSRNLGYRPVITVLPSGANFSVNVIVSGDRRYIRIGVGPMFSSIGQVNTFTYSGR